MDIASFEHYRPVQLERVLPLTPATGDLISYEADAYVYLDNLEFAAVNANLAAGAEAATKPAARAGPHAWPEASA